MQLTKMMMKGKENDALYCNGSMQSLRNCMEEQHSADILRLCFLILKHVNKKEQRNKDDEEE